MADFPKNLHSDAWCPVPFNSITFHPTGAITRCMMNSVPMGDSFDSIEMQELRQDMLDGKWDTDGCGVCWKKENRGIYSQRHNWLSKKMRHEVLNDPAPYHTPKLINNQVTHLFLNFSNVCNFKCRMCSPSFSNSLIPEFKAMASMYADTHWRGNLKYTKNINKINEYLLNNTHILKDVRSIWITGGEPFMDDSCYTLMEILEEHGNVSQIEMVITTNGSKLDVNKLHLFKNLKKLKIDLSIDSTGKMFEYMRSNGVFTWEQMEKLCYDLKYFKKDNSSWFTHEVNSSYQIYNFDNILDFYNFVYRTDGETNIRILIGPDYFGTNIMPQYMKDKALKICENVETRFANHTGLIKNLPNIQQSLKAPFNQELFETFKKYTRSQDKFRSTFLYDYHSELGDLVYEDKK